MPSENSPKKGELFSLREFSVRAGEHLSTAPLSVDLAPGQLLVISGDGGSGKSLISEALAGIVRPNILSVGAPKGGLRTALVPQDARLAVLPTDRVGALLRQGSRGWPGTGAAPTERLLESLKLPMARLQTLTFRDLSASERQRLLLMLALLKEPAVLIMDGMGERLDPSDLKNVRSVLDEVRSRGLRLIVTSRDPDQLGLNCDSFHQLTGPSGEMVVPLVPKAPTPELEDQKHPALEIERLRTARGRTSWLKRQVASYPVDGASFFVRRGEILALLGPAGSGKTTLLETIAGLLASTSGRMRVRGVDATNARGRRLARLHARVQLVFQEGSTALDGQRTVRSLLSEAIRLPGSRNETPSEWLEKLALPPHLLSADADQLSTTEATRVDLARSLAVGPSVLLFDEPRGAGIESDGGALAALLRAEKSRGLAIVIATSSPQVAERLADRVAVIDAGRIIELGKAESVFSGPLHPRTLSFLRGDPVPPSDPTSPLKGCASVGYCPNRRLPECDQTEPTLTAREDRPRAAGRYRVACFHPLIEAPTRAELGKGAPSIPAELMRAQENLSPEPTPNEST